MSKDSNKECVQLIARINAADRHLRRERIIKDRNRSRIVKAEGDHLTKVVQRIMEGTNEIVSALVAYKVDPDGKEVFIGWVLSDGTIEKFEVRKQQPAEPATRAEVSADSASQQADREGIRRQYELEREREILDNELQTNYRIIGTARERQIHNRLLEIDVQLAAIGTAGTRVQRAENGEYQVVKVDDGFGDAFKFRGGQSFRVDAGRFLPSDSAFDQDPIVKATGEYTKGQERADLLGLDLTPDPPPAPIRKTGRGIPVDLGSPFASRESALRTLRGGR